MFTFYCRCLSILLFQEIWMKWLTLSGMLFWLRKGRQKEYVKFCAYRKTDIKIRTKLCVSVDWISCKYFFYYYYTELTYNLCPCLIRQRFFTCIKFSFYLWFQLPVCITDRKNIYIFIFWIRVTYFFIQEVHVIKSCYFFVHFRCCITL